MQPSVSRLLALVLVVTSTWAQAQAQALPAVFTDLGVTMQSRVCGELLTGLSMGGLQTLKLKQAQAKPAGHSAQQAQSAAVYETGAQAVVLLTMSGALTLDERLKAGEVSKAVEQLAPQVHVDTARFCIRRVEAWIRAGRVEKTLVSKAYEQSKTLLDSIYAAKDPNESR